MIWVNPPIMREHNPNNYKIHNICERCKTYGVETRLNTITVMKKTRHSPDPVPHIMTVTEFDLDGAIACWTELLAQNDWKVNKSRAKWLKYFKDLKEILDGESICESK